MQFVSIKPLSVNEAWKGRRVKTDQYKQYEHDLLFLLPKIPLPPPPYTIKFTFGMSNDASDWDNPVKPFQDVLQKKYGFDDKLVRRAIVDKEKVAKGREYIGFEITTYKKQQP